jgi:outer membrane phospholipase A
MDDLALGVWKMKIVSDETNAKREMKLQMTLAPAARRHSLGIKEVLRVSYADTQNQCWQHYYRYQHIVCYSAHLQS